MVKTTSPVWSIDKIGLKKVGKGALIAGIGAFLTYLIEALPGVDLGYWTPIVMTTLSVTTNFVRKWMMNYQ